jgi:hypothetical protein
MKRLSRHTVVVLLVALVTCVAGMSVAVVAFGQSTATNPDATVPAGDYTGTTPATDPVSPYSTSTTTTPTVQTQTVAPTQTGGGVPADTDTQTVEHTVTGGGGDLPSKATRRGPTHLAFTGAEPLWVGVGGVALMLAGLWLSQRRRRGASRS